MFPTPTPKPAMAVKSKPPAPARKNIVSSNTKEPETVADVIAMLDTLFFRIKGFKFSLNSMDTITEHFLNGLAKDVVLPLETFKKAIDCLQMARIEIDCRIPKHFWPVFHQLYLHTAEWQNAVCIFLGDERFKGPKLTCYQRRTVPTLVESFSTPAYQKHQGQTPYRMELSKAQAFLTNSSLQTEKWDEMLVKCRNLAFFLMLEPEAKKSTIELAEKMLNEDAKYPDEEYAVDNFVRFLHILQPLAQRELDDGSGMFGSQLVEQLSDHWRPPRIPADHKAMLLKKMAEGLANQCAFVRQIIETGPVLNGQQYRSLLQKIDFNGPGPSNGTRDNNHLQGPFQYREDNLLFGLN